MSSLLALRGGHVVDPATGVDGPADVLVRDGLIAAVLAGHGQPLPQEAEVIDVAGLVVAPGLIDLHCHLRVPGGEHKETIYSGTLAAAQGGFTTICCMPNTRPVLDTPETVRFLQERIAGEAVVDVRIIAAITLRQEGRELVDMVALGAMAGVVAFSDDGKPVWDPQVLRQAQRAAARAGLPLSLHEEEPTLAGRGVMHAGATALALDLPGLPASAEEAMIGRDLDLLAALVAEEGAESRLRMHIAHVTTAGGVELIRRAKEAGLPVSAEVTPHHLTLTDELAVRPRGGRPYDTATKVNPPLRSAADVAAVREGLRRGILDVIATDHAPHAAADKDCPYEQAAFGISNFETALASSLSLVHEGVLTLPELIAAMAERPAALFPLSSAGARVGSLARGARADILAFDPHEEWQVDASAFASLGHNTPLDGARLRGRVCLTLAGGRVVYHRSRDAARLSII